MNSISSYFMLCIFNNMRMNHSIHIVLETAIRLG